jgi:hypothetical protein
MEDYEILPTLRRAWNVRPENEYASFRVVLEFDPEWDSRDAGVVSNYKTALRMLGGESDTVKELRFKKLNPSSGGSLVKVLCVEPDSDAHTIAKDILETLEYEPWLDVEDYDEVLDEIACEAWAEDYTVKDRIEYMRMNPKQFSWTSFGDLRQQVSGMTFTGYANELING